MLSAPLADNALGRDLSSGACMDGVGGVDQSGGALQMALLRKVLDMAGNQVLPLLEASPAAKSGGNPAHLGQNVDTKA